MKKVTIAFDIDGTLRANREEWHRNIAEPNKRILVQIMGIAHSKNVEVHLWSSRGEEYCRDIRKQFGLERYVKEANCHKKLWRAQQVVEVRGFNSETYQAIRADVFRPDIAYDDQQAFDGADHVIVVREK